MQCCDYKKDLMNRLARAQGHLQKVQKMVEQDEYCIDIITQSLAVQSALRSIDELVLDNHLKTCVHDAMVADKDVETKVSEVIKTIRFMRK